MVLAEDAQELGGLRCDKTFLGQSDVSACGKLLVLEKLLELWSQPGQDNKVRLSPRCCLWRCGTVHASSTDFLEDPGTRTNGLPGGLSLLEGVRNQGVTLHAFP